MGSAGRKRWTAAQRQEVLAAVAQAAEEAGGVYGIVAPVARQLGVPVTTVTRWVRAAGMFEASRPSGRSATERQHAIAIAVEAIDSGQGVATVAQQLGIPTETLRRWLRRRHTQPPLSERTGDLERQVGDLERRVGDLERRIAPDVQ